MHDRPVDQQIVTNANRRVLVLAQNERTARPLERLLAMDSFDVARASDHDTALRLLAGPRVSAIVIGACRDGKTALAMLRRARAEQPHATAIVFAFEAERWMFEKEGCVLLPCPVDYEEIRRAIDGERR